MSDEMEIADIDIDDGMNIDDGDTEMNDDDDGKLNDIFDSIGAEGEIDMDAKSSVVGESEVLSGVPYNDIIIEDTIETTDVLDDGDDELIKDEDENEAVIDELDFDLIEGGDGEGVVVAVEAPVEEVTVEEAHVEETPVEEVAIEEAHVEETPVEEVAVEEAPAEVDVAEGVAEVVTEEVNESVNELVDEIVGEPVDELNEPDTEAISEIVSEPKDDPVVEDNEKASDGIAVESVDEVVDTINEKQPESGDIKRASVIESYEIDESDNTEIEVSEPALVDEVEKADEPVEDAHEHTNDHTLVLTHEHTHEHTLDIPITIHYNTNTNLLFPNDSFNYPTLLHEISDITIEDLFNTIRQVFTDSFTINDELFLEFKQLGLSIGEDNFYAKEVNLQDFLNIFKDLLHNTPDEEKPKSLEIFISKSSRFISKFNFISERIREGMGLLELQHFNENRNIYDDNESTEIYDEIYYEGVIEGEGEGEVEGGKADVGGVADDVPDLGGENEIQSENLDGNEVEEHVEEHVEDHVEEYVEEHVEVQEQEKAEDPQSKAEEQVEVPVETNGKELTQTKDEDTSHELQDEFDLDDLDGIKEEDKPLSHISIEPEENRIASNDLELDFDLDETEGEDTHPSKRLGEESHDSVTKKQKITVS